MKAYSIILRGRVQGVGMRNFAGRKARKLAITGYVENLADGSVHIHAEGTEEQLKKYLEEISKGSIATKISGGRIERIEFESVALENHTTFSR